MDEALHPGPGEKLGFSYDQREKRIHYTESPTHIEIRLESLVGDTPPELIAVIDKSTHKIEEASCVVTVWLTPIPA